MRGGGFLRILVLIVLLSTFIFATTKFSSISGLAGVTNVARIFDFDNDGDNDILAFSDKIDSTETYIKVYDWNFNTYNLFQLISNEQLERCSLSYQDFNNDGFLDIFYSCFNASNKLVSRVYFFNGTKFNLKFNLTSNYNGFGNNFYGDSLVFDFNNDGFPDIISCYNINSNNKLKLYLYNSSNNNFTIADSNITIPNSMNSCYLSELDLDNDQDLDIIYYSYDANNFTIYENKFCNHDNCLGSGFQKIDNDLYFNNSFFSATKIKSLKAFDENNDGYSDLYYIVDKGEISVSNAQVRDIEYGYFLNKHRLENQEISSKALNLIKLEYIQNNALEMNLSWETYLGDRNYFNLEYQSDSLFNNLNISAINYSYGNFFVNNYDYNSGYGNLFGRKNLKLFFENRAFNYTLTNLLASKTISNTTNGIYFTNYTYTNPLFLAYNKSFSYELCDGLDNDGDGIIDNSFNMILPNSSVVLIDFSNVIRNYATSATFTFGNYSIKFDCSKRIERFPRVITSTAGSTGEKASSNAGGAITVANKLPIVKEESTTPIIKNDDPFVDKSDFLKPTSYTDPKTDKIIQSLINDRVRHSTKYQYVNGRTRIIEELKNLDLYEVSNVSLTVQIPKAIAKSAYDINLITNNIIIEEDPIIQFTLNNLKSYESKYVIYEFDKEISVADLRNLQYEIDFGIGNTQEQIKEIKEQIIQTEKVLEVINQVEIKENTTILTLNIELDKFATLYNVSIYQEIPKCLLEEINDQVAESDVNFEIVEADPLIVWHFDKLLDSQKIQLAIKSVADEDCTNLVQTTSLAKQIVFSNSNFNKFNVFIALLLIPIFAGVLILIGEFSKRNKHHNDKINFLIDYVKKHYHKGISKDKIKAKLELEGYSDDDIETAMKLNSKTKVHYFFQKSNIGVHELVLLFLVFINILDFLEFLSGDVDYFKKIISWILLGYLLYRSSIVSIINGERSNAIDIFLIISFFLLTLKNIVGFAKVAITEANLVQDLYAFIWRYNHIFETYAFFIGLIGLIILSFFIARKEPRNPSILASFIKKPTFLKKLIVTNGFLILFFICVFNLMFEWLAIAVDAFILVITLIIGIIIIFKHHRKINPIDFLEEISEESEEFYESIISLFHYKKFLPLAFSGMLILYVLTEIANFIVPYLTGIYDIIYFGNFNAQHMPLFNLKDFMNPDASLFAFQAIGATILEQILIGVVYLFNVIAILYLLFLPARIWYNYFKQKNLPISKVKPFIFSAGELGLFFSSLVIFFSRPLFRLEALRTFDVIAQEKTLVGVDILTQAISLNNLPILIIIAIFGGIIIGILGHCFEKAGTDVVVLFSLSFFTYYVYIFSGVQYTYYVDVISSMFLGGFNFIRFVIGIYLFLFALSSFLGIYCLGFLTMFYFYLPLKIQLFLAKHNFYHQDLYHLKHKQSFISHHGIHAVNYIKRSIEEGHELFLIVEHLEEKGWTLEDIEEAVHEAVSDEKLWQGFDHYKHKHHNKHIVSALHKFIKEEYYANKRDLKEIIDELLNIQFTLDDVIYALQITAPKTSGFNFKNKKSSVNLNIDKHYKKLNSFLVKCEDEGLSLNEIHKHFDFFEKKDCAKLIEITAQALLHRHEKLSEFVNDLKSFKYSEDDIRVSLIGITPKNLIDEEILRYL